jgi:type II secretory pathway component GspD/PulD (secretin)
MKSLILYALLSLLPASLIAAEQITIQAKFFEAGKEAIPHDLTKLAKTKGIDMLSAPSVTTKSGQQAQIEVIREHQPASVAPSAFKPVPVGITVRVTPQLKGDRIAYTAQLTVSELVTNKASDRQTSSEITSRDIYVSGTPKDGEEVWLDFTDPSNGKKIVVWLHFKHEGA